MPTLIVNAGLIGVALNSDPSMEDRGAYLERSDPEFAGGAGAAWWTTDKAKAQRFPSMIHALEEWKRQSKTRPLRADGRPNRPLTAYSVTFEEVSE